MFTVNLNIFSIDFFWKFGAGLPVGFAPVKNQLFNFDRFFVHITWTLKKKIHLRLFLKKSGSLKRARKFGPFGMINLRKYNGN